MKTAKRTAISLTLVLLTAAVARSAEEPFGPEAVVAKQTAKSIDTRTASCLVKVTADPAVLPVTFDTIDSLLHSSGVAGKAAREVLDISLDEIPFDNIEIIPLSPDDDDGGFGGIGIPPIFPTNPPGTPYNRNVRFPDNAPNQDPLMKPSSSIARSRPPGQPAAPDSGTTRYDSSSRYNYVYGRARKAQSGLADEHSYYYSKPRAAPGLTQTRYTTAAKSSTSPTEQTFLFHLRIMLHDNLKPAAEEFMTLLIANLRLALKDAYEEYHRNLDSRYSLVADEANRAEEILVRMQKEMRELSTAVSHDLSRTAILSTISRNRQKLQAIVMDKASDEVLMEAQMKRINQTRIKIEQQLQEDPIKIELEKIVELNTEQLAAAQANVKSSRAPVTQLDLMNEKLARARIELAQRRQELSKSAGGDLIDSLNNKLADMSLKAMHGDAEYEALEEQLDEAQSLLGRADAYELLTLKANIARNGLEEALIWRDRLERKARLIQPPVVSVIGGR